MLFKQKKEIHISWIATPNLRKRRIEKGLSLMLFAKKLGGYSKQYLSEIETGKRSINSVLMNKIENTLQKL